MNLNSFGTTASKLARNPLGIIALFIVLIYGIACLTFGFSHNLPEKSAWIFISFIIIYPLVVLFVFYRLVTKHHTKLYAPADFPRPEDFLQCIYGNQERALTRGEFLYHTVNQTPETPDGARTGEPN
jgi:hypothetical protein